MKEIAASVALSTLAAAGVEAQENPRVAPPAVYDVAPGLGHFTDDVLFGEVWERKDLGPRDRSLTTLAVLVSTGKSAQLAGHLRRALDNGVRQEEIGELITHLAFYSGWPNAISAVTETKKVFDERGIGPVAKSDAPRIELDAAAEALRSGAVDAAVAPTAAALADLTNRVLFGDLWRRAELSARDRSLVTMAALIATGQPDQLSFHLTRALDNGLTHAEAAEVVTQAAFYAGWPRAMSAVPVLKKVFEGRQKTSANATGGGNIQIVRAAPGGGIDAPAEYFTGRVRIATQYKGDEPAKIGGATVSFEAGAHTAWHTHPLGQTLYIVSGKAWVQKEGGPIEEAGQGDVVWIPPNIRHWHGASPAGPMVHFAVSEALDGSVVTWMEKVQDDQYNAGPAR
ncbi:MULTISPECIES: carboxymuconolactone decarboxylase family protein [unclassified Mesorhizobium]|uniref:(R)-mandelonitrile lyase n=1 Tax=unclassified Mesorhizobium TaxID=325217 RepID=UPI00112B1166|nr:MULTISPECIES: carboxymuconolactone decarboxylase family protein [unclassified Mesorhizobium]MBZ9700543.1 carboxymuconolactone decarboxylase family protein [Mesorhizobium sp. CO1-1-3]MBZ9946479.1 carboxymuconolactone decarboxylase family protein [Mesorhizobium sp. BR1-1-11]TPI96530.1 cupin domain-containing protein [Mesorhizobium sp. B2-8-1]